LQLNGHDPSNASTHLGGISGAFPDAVPWQGDGGWQAFFPLSALNCSGEQSLRVVETTSNVATPTGFDQGGICATSQ